MSVARDLLERLMENVLDEGAGPMLSVLDNDGEVCYQLLTPDLMDLFDEIKAELETKGEQDAD